MNAEDPRALTAAARRPWYRVLYVQVLIAIVIGVALGHFAPTTGTNMKIFGDIFVNLIKMMIAPVIFCTIVHGIASISDLRRVGWVFVKALIYFEAVSTFALAIGLVVGNVLHPGSGFNINPATLNTKDVDKYIAAAKSDSVLDHILAIIPQSFGDVFAKGDVLQVLLVAILTGIAVSMMGPVGERITSAIDSAGKMFFRIIGIIVLFAPIGAFGAIAFTVGKYGIGSLAYLGFLIGSFYLTSVLFVLIVLGAIAYLTGFSILRFLAYIKDELLIVLGTSSSETVLPNMIRKMEALGASKSVVGLVIPTGYSFNLDGTNIYMTLSILFLAQATGVDLSFAQQLEILLVAALTSKGASGITGAGFITLAATLDQVHAVPTAAIAIIFGIDKFMSECRALTNLVGNGVATLVVSRWQGELDRAKLNAAMAHPVAVSDVVEAQIA